MERKTSVLDAQRAHDLGAGCGGQDDGEWLSAQLGSGGREARDGGSRQLGERRFPLAEVVGEKSGLALAVALDHAAANQVSQQPGANDREQVGDGDVRDARQSVEHGYAVAAGGDSYEDTMQDDGV
jgi:hypothetical protein